MSASPPPPSTSPPSPVIHIPAPRPLTRDDVRLMLDLSQPEVALEIEQLLDDEASKAQSKVPKYTLKLKDITKQYVALQDRGEQWAAQLQRTTASIQRLQKEVAYLEDRKECWDEVVGPVGQRMLNERLGKSAKRTKGTAKKRKPSQSPVVVDAGGGKGSGGKAANKPLTSQPRQPSTHSTHWQHCSRDGKLLSPASLLTCTVFCDVLHAVLVSGVPAKRLRV